MYSKLYDLITYAYENSEFYNRKISIKPNYTEEELFNSIPILTKDDLQKYKDDIIINKYKYGGIKELNKVYTSGSTGKSTEIYWDTDDYYRSNLTIWRLRKKWYCITPNSPLVVFNSFIFNGNKLSIPKKIDYQQNGKVLALSKFHMSDEHIFKYCKEINKFQPHWMSVQTSTLVRLIEFMEKYSINFPSLRYIELNGELVPKSSMNLFRNTFNIPIANMYGALEVNSIAYECPYHTLHVIEDNIFLETIKTLDTNTALVTSFHNKVMPIIRYEIGDEIIISDTTECPCGHVSKSILNINGRSTDKIITFNNQYISPYVLIYCIENTNLIMHNSIRQFKIIQYDFNYLSIILKIDVTFNKWEKAIIKELKRNIYEVVDLNDWKIEIKLSDNINDFNESKFKIFENKMKR